jgi:hypothetical protein
MGINVLVHQSSLIIRDIIVMNGLFKQAEVAEHLAFNSRCSSRFLTRRQMISVIQATVLLLC